MPSSDNLGLCWEIKTYGLALKSNQARWRHRCEWIGLFSAHLGNVRAVTYTQAKIRASKGPFPLFCALLYLGKTAKMVRLFQREPIAIVLRFQGVPHLHGSFHATGGNVPAITRSIIRSGSVSSCGSPSKNMQTSRTPMSVSRSNHRNCRFGPILFVVLREGGNLMPLKK